MSTVKPISSQEEYDSHVASLPTSALSVIYFHAPWAAPCAQMSTILSALASTYPRSDPASVSFISVDAENLPDLSELHDVTAVPFVVLQKSGKTVQTVSGTDAATLRSAVEAHAPSTSTTTSSSSTTLPEKQTVTRPMTQPEPSSLSPSQIASAAASTGGVASTTTTTSSTGAKNLSSYSPSAGDPSTAPQFSSSSLPSGSNGTANGTTSQEELQTRLRELTHAAPVMLFMKGTPSAPQCGFSRQLVSILRENSVRYGFFNILADDEVRQGLKEYSDWPTFPQLYLNGELVGGLDIVKEELGSNAAFFDEFRVSSARNDGGGPSAAGMTQASGVEA